jgi:RNA polymerase sigma-B factor
MNRHLTLTTYENQGSSSPHLDARQRRRLRTQSLFATATEAPDAEVRHSALRQVIELNMEVARTLARPYVGHGVPTDDLYQVAYAALVRSARDFDPRHGVDFLSYAVPTVRGEIRRYFRDIAWTIRPPRRIQETQSAVAAARERLHQDSGAEPTTAQIAAEVEVPEGVVIEALSANGCFTPSSLDLPLGEDSSGTIGDQLGAQEDGFDMVETREVLRPALAKLAGRDRAIIRMRFYDGLTQREIGERIGVTQMQVSRLLTRILEDLRIDISDETGAVPA